MLATILVAAAGCGDTTNNSSQGASSGGTRSSSSSTNSTEQPGTGGTTKATSEKPNTGGTSSQGGTQGTSDTKIAVGGSADPGAGGTATSATNAVGGSSVAAGGKQTSGGSSSLGDGGTKAAGGSVTAGGTTPTSGAAATGGRTSVVVPTAGKSAGGATSTATGGSGGGNPTGGSTGTGQPSAENSGADCNATSAALLAAQNKKLPDLFAMHSGTRISAKADWECRRNEIKADLEKYEIGPKPDPSTATVKATLSGTNLSVAVTTSSGSLSIKSAVSGSGSCVVIATDMDLNLVSGCTKVTFSTADVIPYNNGSGSQSKSDPFYKVYPDLWGKIGNYTAWSWGVSRLIDGLDQVKDQLKIDMTKIATHGCSYAGKMALFAGAFDERVALTIAEESGGGGINAWRTSADFTSRTGTSVEKIDNTNYAWFMSSMKSLDPYKLPHDHHGLIAMVAPRAIIILGNPGYEWLGDESGYKSTVAAVEVFKALGVADHIGYDFTGNHGHCSAPQTQKDSINAFANKYLKGQNATTNIAIKPSASNFDLSAAFDWTAPTLN